MPLYDYQCKNCRAIFEVRATFKEKAAGLQPHCPECRSKKTHQLLTTGTYLRQPADGGSVSGPTCGPGCGGNCSNCGK